LASITVKGEVEEGNDLELLRMIFVSHHFGIYVTTVFYGGQDECKHVMNTIMRGESENIPVPNLQGDLGMCALLYSIRS